MSNLTTALRYWATTEFRYAGPFDTPQEAFAWIEGQFEIDMSDRRDEECEYVARTKYTSMGKDEGAIATDEAAIYEEGYSEWPRIKKHLEKHSHRDAEA